MKLKEMTSSMKLAKPLPSPGPIPFVTHRGAGAFTEADFVKSPGPMNGTKVFDLNLKDQGVHSDLSESGSGSECSSPAAV